VPIRAKRTGGITEIRGPTNGMKETRPLKIPSSSAKGTPMRYSATVERTPMTSIEPSWPTNHRWTVS
jgi:hypothetical protein